MSTVTKSLRHALDILLFLALCFTEFAIRHWFKPLRRGFFCGDESLEYPFQPQTIGMSMLLAIVVGIPAIVIVTVELCRRLPSSAGADKPHGTSFCCHLGQRMRHCYAQLGYYLFGFAMNLVALEIAKYSVGRLRPYFFSVCQPELPDGSTCDSPRNQGRYIEAYTCRGVGVSPLALQQLNLAFPSGHTSTSFYAMLYTCIYLQVALNTGASKLLTHLLQFVFVMLAWYVSLTRISDYWHHWSDVLAGMALGTTFALVAALFVADLFGRRRAGRTHANNIASTSSSAHSATPVLPAYTFGNVPYLPHHHQHHLAAHQHPYGQTYHNYGYVP